ncbi:hypothetical protein [Ensifer sp. 1H6]|uniref:hypothetical protein n=1 Tax=Ensifer sp. 1H6 TaxID=1911585 RepID=UPI0032AF6A15
MTKPLESEPAEIGIVVYPRALKSAVHGLTDMFQVAGMQATEQGGARAPRIRVSHWQLQEDGSVEKTLDTHPGPSSGLVALILPPTLAELPVGGRMGQLPAFVREQHAGGTTSARSAAAPICWRNPGSPQVARSPPIGRTRT